MTWVYGLCIFAASFAGGLIAYVLWQWRQVRRSSPVPTLEEFKAATEQMMRDMRQFRDEPMTIVHPDTAPLGYGCPRHGINSAVMNPDSTWYCGECVS